MSQRSNESGIREGGQGGNFEDAYMNEDEEMDQIMQRELEGVEVENSIDMSNKKAVEGESNQRVTNGNTTADSSNLQNEQRQSSGSNGRSKPSKNSKQLVNSTNKSIKQSNLADWVSSATKTSASKNLVNGIQVQNLVGHKRTDTNR